MKAGRRNIKSGEEFEKFFDKPTGSVQTIKRDAKLSDTIEFLPKAIHLVVPQTRRIAKHLERETQYQTCKSIWEWCYNHLQYKEDEKGKEQIKSPNVSFATRKIGIDCDDFTVIISSMLHNLKINHLFKVVMYNEENGFQHIYPVAILSNGRQVPIDCVLDSFDFEVPYIDKIEKNMELEFLNGLGNITGLDNKPMNVDASDLLDGFEQDMGKLFKKPIKETKVFQAVKKGINVVNKVNPGAVLLRAGLLVGMKTNMFRIAERLKYAYLTPEQARAKNLDMTKYQKVVEVKQRLEKIFYGAGGDEKNLKQSILTGNGNKGNEVPLNGMGYASNRAYSEQDSISSIIGADSYASEVEGVEGLGSLGEPATAAAIAAASSVLAAIAGLMKNIGSLKKGESEGNTTTPEVNQEEPIVEIPPIPQTKVNTTTPNFNVNESTNSGGGGENEDTPADTETNRGAASQTQREASEVVNNQASDSNKETQTFWESAKAWFVKNQKAIGISVGSAVVIGLSIWGYKAYKKSKKQSVSGMKGISKKVKAAKAKKAKEDFKLRFKRLK